MTSDRPRPVEAEDDRREATPAELFRLHARAVLAACLANTRNHHDAEDVMQTVFLKAITKVSGLRDPDRARAWLLQMARRECIDFHRKKKPLKPLLDEPSAPPTPEDAARERLHEAIRKLPQDYREAILLYYLDGRNCAGVAATLGATEPAVRQRLVRARAMLHVLLAEDRP
jgi:RNA polymerase sigma factor (sigma-70 family)